MSVTAPISWHKAVQSKVLMIWKLKNLCLLQSTTLSQSQLTTKSFSVALTVQQKLQLVGEEKSPSPDLYCQKNFKENEDMEVKNDEKRAFIQIYDKKSEYDIEDAYEAEAEHADAMDDNQLCRDF